MNAPCTCEATHLPPKLVVLTGGPGAGKTAVLEIVRKHFCEHVVVLPEAASIVFGGGFPRRASIAARKAAQRAIFHVQRELESLAVEEGLAAVVLCDRGTVDGLAYWPDDSSSAPAELGITLDEERLRYAAVIHLRTPTADGGYNHQNPLRIESAKQAETVDRRLAEVWSGHPHVFVVDSTARFLDKVKLALELIRQEVPACCKGHAVPDEDAF